MGTKLVETGEVYGPRAKHLGAPILKPERQKVRDHAFINVDEGESMIKASTCAGHIGMPTIRSAWTGATLGQANGNVETTRHVVKGSYSLGMAIGFQKSTAQGLLADVTAGSPQRFLFASTQHPSLPEEQPQHPGPLKVELELPSGPSMFISLRKGTLHFAEEINATLWEENHRKVRGEATEADEAGLPEAVDDGEVRSVAVRSGPAVTGQPGRLAPGRNDV